MKSNTATLLLLTLIYSGAGVSYVNTPASHQVVEPLDRLANNVNSPKAANI
jgi:hypothetical protein